LQRKTTSEFSDVTSWKKPCLDVNMKYITPKFTKEVTKFGELEVKGHIRLLNMETIWKLKNVNPIF